MTIKTPVNEKINEALTALENAYKTACDNHDWRITGQLDQMIRDLKQIKGQSTESQILSVDSFLEDLAR